MSVGSGSRWQSTRRVRLRPNLEHSSPRPTAVSYPVFRSLAVRARAPCGSVPADTAETSGTGCRSRPLSQISWRVRVAHQSTEDTRLLSLPSLRTSVTDQYWVLGPRSTRWGRPDG